MSHRDKRIDDMKKRDCDAVIDNFNTLREALKEEDEDTTDSMIRGFGLLKHAEALFLRGYDELWEVIRIKYKR